MSLLASVAAAVRDAHVRGRCPIAVVVDRETFFAGVALELRIPTPSAERPQLMAVDGHPQVVVVDEPGRTDFELLFL